MQYRTAVLEDSISSRFISRFCTIIATLGTREEGIQKGIYMYKMWDVVRVGFCSFVLLCVGESNQLLRLTPDDRCPRILGPHPP